MLSKRIIPCLDVRDGRTTKGIKFRDNIDIGDPVEMGRFYYEEGADEIVFYDITASSDRRPIMLDVVRRVAETIFIPFSVGGGIRTLEDMRDVLLAGAEKVSVNSAAVLNPEIIRQGAKAFGSQCIVLGMDVKQVPPSAEIPSGYEMVINGGRTPMGIDALWWAQEAERLGAGEICLNSIDADGTQRRLRVEPHPPDFNPGAHSRHRLRRGGDTGTPARSALRRPRRCRTHSFHGPLRNLHHQGDQEYSFKNEALR